MDLRGKTLDLKSAYRQLPVSEEHLRYSLFTIPSADGYNKMIFRAFAMPFGSVHSVHFFLRTARALWAIGASCLSLLWSNFYDDYVFFSPSQLTDSSERASCLFFDMLGWDYDRDGDKCVPFAQFVEALGVRIDLVESSNMRAFVSNTASRISELTTEIDGVLKDDKLTREHALRLRGRLGFAEGQIFGRTCRKTLKLVTEFAYSSSHCLKLTSTLRKSLIDFRHSLNHSQSRRVGRNSSQCWFIFTDASFERSDSSCDACLGGVVADPDGRMLEFFSVDVEPAYLVKLGSLYKHTVIYELELLAGVLAIRLWCRFIEDRQCVLYVDNDGARHSYISGVSHDPVVETILDDFVFFEESCRTSLWVARVPSPSNVADLPSRRDFSFLAEKGCERVPVSTDLFPLIDLPMEVTDST